MAMARIEASKIVDWESFHRTCADALGFPDFYGKNLNAWIDCLTYLRDGDGMSRFCLMEDECLDTEVTDTKAFSACGPEILLALVECTAFVNSRYIEIGQSPALRLIFL